MATLMLKLALAVLALSAALFAAEMIIYLIKLEFY